MGGELRLRRVSDYRDGTMGRYGVDLGGAGGVGTVNNDGSGCRATVVMADIRQPVQIYQNSSFLPPTPVTKLYSSPLPPLSEIFGIQ